MAVGSPASEAEEVQEKFGVTDPISLAYSAPRDEEETHQMLGYLSSVCPSESEEGWHARWEVLIDMEQKCSDWLVYECGIIVPEPVGDKIFAPSKVLTFGSFRLGIITPASDIDTLVLIPQSISREQFFSEFVVGILANEPDVTECLLVTDARVPVAKVKYRGISLDILVVCCPPNTILSDMESVDDEMIFLVGEKCMKSMNGIRVADKILRVVPDPQTFRQATRLIKYWAQMRCIYGNSVGYFGGVSWSMAVARVCQLYPNMSAKQIVERFFYTFSSWPWDENRPVVLCTASDMKIPPSLIRAHGTAIFSQFRDWNPQKYPSDRFQIMPVVTPIFPSHNTTYNVTETHKTVILDELRRGKEIIQLMSFSGGEIGWADLCRPCPFFDLFTSFLELRVTAKDEMTLAKFKGLVESRVRSLIRAIETWARRPHPDFFRLEGPEGSGPLESLGGCFFIGLQGASEAVDLRPAIAQFISETMEKALESPEWADILPEDIRLVVSVTTEPFPKR